MASSDPALAAEPDTPAATPDGVSAFVARVLDQLALSAWLPAAFLTSSIAVLLEFRSAKSANLLKAVQALTAQPLQALVVVIPLLVIATVITQAFSFECIRVLEGYWGTSRLAHLVHRPMVWRHIRRQRSIYTRLEREQLRAIRKAMHQMLEDGTPYPVYKAIEAQVTGQTLPSLTAEQREILGRTEWMPLCDASHLARIQTLVKAHERYPQAHRVMPTRLGNLIRATEDLLDSGTQDVQSFVHRRRNLVSSRIRAQHDQFRTRLEMYCTLVLVNGVLLALAPLILADHVGGTASAVTSAGFAAMGIVSYLAALTSAEGYCQILVHMNEAA